MRKRKIYALYKGDKWITDGTREELAEYLNVKIRTIDFYATKKWKERNKGNGYLIIRVEDNNEEN